MRLRLPFTGRRRAGLWMRTALALGLLSSAVPAADIHLMTSGGFAAVVEELAPRYERQSGNHIIVIRGASMGATPEAIPARLKRGEEADVVILARSALDALVADGAVQKGSEVDLVRSPHRDGGESRGAGSGYFLRRCIQADPARRKIGGVFG